MCSINKHQGLHINSNDYKHKKNLFKQMQTHATMNTQLIKRKKDMKQALIAKIISKKMISGEIGCKCCGAFL